MSEVLKRFETSLASDQKILAKIKELGFTGQGEAYSEKGRRNPIRDDTGPALEVIARLQQPKRIVEVGTAYGLSGLWLMLGYSASQMETIEFDLKVALEANKNFKEAGLGDRVVVHSGDAGDVLKKTTQGIDLLFLDHEKGLYLPHFKLVESFMNPNSLVVADNVIDRQQEAQPFIDYISSYYPTHIVSTECGLLVARIIK